MTHLSVSGDDFSPAHYGLYTKTAVQGVRTAPILSGVARAKSTGLALLFESERGGPLCVFVLLCASTRALIRPLLLNSTDYTMPERRCVRCTLPRLRDTSIKMIIQNKNRAALLLD